MDSGPPKHVSASVTLPPDADAQRDASQDVIRAMEAHGFGEADCFAVRLALEEAVVNAFKHGSRGIDSPTVDLEWRVDDERVVVTVRDRGPGFDPGGVPDPTSPDRIELPTGRGLMLMKAYMSDIAYNDRGNAVTMTYVKGARSEEE